MKRLIGFIVFLLFVISSSVICYGSTGETDITPYYVSVSSYYINFDIDTDGRANYTIYVSPKSEDSLSRVNAIVKITKGGTTFMSETVPLTYNQSFRRFMHFDELYLSETGTYKLTVTFKCYNGNTLLESLGPESKSAIY